MYSTCPQMNTPAMRGPFYRSILGVISLHRDRRFHARWVSLLLLLNAAFVLKPLKKMKCDVTSRKVRPWAKRERRGSETGQYKCSIIWESAVVAASVGIRYDTKQSETTHIIIHEGPVCRQQAELRHQFLLVANTRKLDMRGLFLTSVLETSDKGLKEKVIISIDVILWQRDQTGCYKSFKKLHRNASK